MKRRNVVSNLLSLYLICGACTTALGLESEKPPQSSNSRDASTGEPSNNKEDETAKGRFVALPIIITEPAVGEGLGVGLIYFHAKDDDKDNKDRQTKVSTARSIGRTGNKKEPPPTATGIFGAYTNNDTNGFGIGHSASLRDDTYRLLGALASMKVIASLYESDVPLNFELEGNLAVGNLKRRLGSSNIFLGVGISALEAEADFKIGTGDDLFESFFDFSFTNIGLAGIAIYDSRDDTMMPSTGQLAEFTTWRYDDAIGGDFDYWNLRLKLHSFHQLHERFVLGLRVDVSTVDGAPPFYAIPFVSLRGIPALRYQGDTAGVFEVEGRYQLAERWAVIAFAGAGFTKADGALDTSDDIKSYGIGVRFKALKAQNVWLGVDLAEGPEESAWYIQLGHAW